MDAPDRPIVSPDSAEVRTGPAGRGLRTTFDASAAHYQSARPDYPSALFEDLLHLTGVEPPGPLLEIGPGPGKATLSLARRGFRITAIELGHDLALQAEANLASYPEVTVINANFETWVPDHLAPYDLVYAATSWHWVDPATRFALAANMLRPGGHLAVWGAGHAMPVGFDPFFTTIQQVYDEIGEGHPGPWPPPPPEESPDLVSDFKASGLFEPVGVRRYLWSLQYSAETYIALLDTFSGHIAMEASKRDHLYAEIRRLLAARPSGELTRHWSSVLTVGRRVRTNS